MRWFVADLQPGFIPDVPDGAVFVATGSGFAIFQVPDQVPIGTHAQLALLGKHVAVSGTDLTGTVKAFRASDQRYGVLIDDEIPFSVTEGWYRQNDLVELP